MKGSPRRVLVGLLLAVTPLAWGSAQAEVGQQQSAVVEYAQPLRFATATHVLGLRLQALTVAPNGGEKPATLPAQDNEEGEQPLPLLALFAGSLKQRAPALLQSLSAELKTVHKLIGGEDKAALGRAVGRAQRDLARARAVLLPDVLASDPAFQAALIAKLANSERGFGEAYEEAATGDASVYPLAWLKLQRAEALWRELVQDLPAARGEAELALDKLNALMPSVQPPDTFNDPEDVEGAALNLVFALEGALQQPLMLRGIASALALMHHQVRDACAAAHAGRPRLMLEHALAARVTYSAHLASTLAMLAPDVHSDFNGIWHNLDTVRSGDAGAVCQALKAAIKRAQAKFG